MEIVRKIFGIILCGIGLIIWSIDYLVFTAIGALTAWIAAAVGITGHAVLGVQVIGWILTFSIMIFLLVAGFCVILFGVSQMSDS